MKKPAKKTSKKRKPKQEKTHFDLLMDIHLQLTGFYEATGGIWASDIYESVDKAAERVLDAANEIHGWKREDRDLSKDMERLGYVAVVESRA